MTCAVPNFPGGVSGEPNAAASHFFASPSEILSQHNQMAPTHLMCETVEFESYSVQTKVSDRENAHSVPMQLQLHRK